MTRFKDLGSNMGSKTDITVEKIKALVGGFIKQTKSLKTGVYFSVEEEINSIGNEVRRKTFEISLKVIAREYGLTIQEVHGRLSSAPSVPVVESKT